jgi:hypothetical protein
VRQLDMLENIFNDINFEIGYATIPARIDLWMQTSLPGYYIPFHDVFEDEMPDFKARVKLLNFLASAPKAIKCGLIDVENGLIYRYSSRLWVQLLCILGLILEIAAFFGIILWITVANSSILPDGIANRGPLLIGWAAVLTGLLVHIGVGAAKRLQSQKTHPPVMSIWDLPRVINTKVGIYLLRIFMAFVGFGGLVFGYGIGKLTPLSAFLVGYSLDSVIDLLSAGLEQKANTQISTIKQNLGMN